MYINKYNAKKPHSIHKMKQVHTFNHHEYFHTFHNQIRGDVSIPVYHALRQRGGGFGSIFKIISRYALPILKKYIFPHVATSLVSTASDVASGTPIKSTLKKNSKAFIKNVANEVIKSSQKGSGVRKVCLSKI